MHFKYFSTSDGNIHKLEQIVISLASISTANNFKIAEDIF